MLISTDNIHVCSFSLHARLKQQLYNGETSTTTRSDQKAQVQKEKSAYGRYAACDNCVDRECLLINVNSFVIE